MNEDRSLTIYFNNGTEMQVAFPAQVKNSLGALVETLKRVLEADKLVIQTKDRLLVIPWSAVSYVAADGVPPNALPLGSIKGAQVNVVNAKR
jgi:hypothetical protein